MLRKELRNVLAEGDRKRQQQSRKIVTQLPPPIAPVFLPTIHRLIVTGMKVRRTCQRKVRMALQDASQLRCQCNLCAQTSVTTTVLQQLIDLLSSSCFDGGTALKTQGIPRNEALKWLGKNTNLSAYSNSQRVQRYSLATIYYSMNGDRWENNTNWLMTS